MSVIVERLETAMVDIADELEDTGYSLHLDAPKGYVWVANDLPSYHINYATNSQSWLSKAVREERAALRLGLRKVTDPDALARHRHDLDDDSWGASVNAPETLPFGNQL